MSSLTPSWIVPKPLQLGEAVRVIAPASGFDHQLVRQAIAWLSQRFRVRYESGMFERLGYLAGADERRLQELREALSEPDTRAIFAARGGYGAMRIAHRVDWTLLRRQPRWLVGFSDITALHMEAAAQGVVSLHGSNLGGLAEPSTAEQLLSCLAGQHTGRRFAGLEVLVCGRRSGPLFGGNLALMHAYAAAGRLRVPPGCVLLLEDVGERPYRIDRMLYSLALGGYLKGVAAVVLGQFIDCEPGTDGVTAIAAAMATLKPLGVPVLAGLPVGHGDCNEPVMLGATVRVDARLEGSLEFVG